MRDAIDRFNRFDLAVMDKENQELFAHIIDKIKTNGDLPHLVGLKWDGATLNQELSIVVSEANAELKAIIDQLAQDKACCQKPEFWNEDEFKVLCYKCKIGMPQCGALMT